jgi:hypothetical protein
MHVHCSLLLIKQLLARCSDASCWTDVSDRFKIRRVLCPQVISKPQRVQQTLRQPYHAVQLPPIQRARKPQQQQAVQQHQQHLEFPAWADRYRRQVRSLPQGMAPLHNLLHSVDRLLQRAEHCGSHSGVMKAYLGLGLIDLTSQAWQQRLARLHELKDKVGTAVAAPK